MKGPESLARRVWERRGLFPWLLWIVLIPLSLLYSLWARLRNSLYSAARLRIKKLPCLVVSVGNLTVGGTGKTPTTLWLAQELTERGYRVAILSRGYKSKGSGPRILEPGSEQIENAQIVGDEPMIMAGLYGNKVGVGKRRYEVGTCLLQENEIDVFLLDDGFQHRRLHRDLDLLLLGEDWQGWLLPAGPFREPRSALGRAHICLVTGSREKWDPFLFRKSKKPVCFYGSLEPTAVVVWEDQRWVEVPLGKVSGCKILAISGIANAAVFYRMIQDWGGDIVDTLEFPDHHEYSTKDWQTISRCARNVDRVITTEKDIVKLVQFPFANDKLYALRVSMVVDEGRKLVDAVVEALGVKRSEAEERRRADA